jgi:hypothetical protein
VYTWPLYFRFELGDIIRENEVIAFYDESPMLGIVIDIKRSYYIFSHDEDPEYHDKLTIMWISRLFVEELPSELVHLVSRA